MSVSSSQTSPSTPLPGTQLPGLGRRFSVRLRLLLFVVGSGLLILGVSSLLIFTTAESNAIEEVKTYAQEIASTRALEMNERFARLSQTARAAAAAETALATQPGDRHLEQVRQTLAEIAKRQLDFLNISLFYDKQVIPGHVYAAVWEPRDESKSDLPTQPTTPFYPNLPGDSPFDPSQPTYDYYINTPRFELARTLKVYQSAWTDVFRDVDGRPGKVYVIAGIAPIVDAGERAAQLTRQLLAFSRRPDAALRDIVRTGAVDLLQLPVHDKEILESVERALLLASTTAAPAPVPSTAAAPPSSRLGRSRYSPSKTSIDPTPA